MDKGEEPKWTIYEPILISHQKAQQEHATLLEKIKRKPAPPPGPAPAAPRPAPASPRRVGGPHQDLVVLQRPPAGERLKPVDSARFDPRRNLPRLQPLQREAVADSKSARSARTARKHREQGVLTPDSDVHGDLELADNPEIGDAALLSEHLEVGIADQVKAVMQELASLRQLKGSLVAKLAALKRRVAEVTQEREEEEEHCLKVTRKLHEESERCRGFQLRVEDLEEQNRELHATVEGLRAAAASRASASLSQDLVDEMERLRGQNAALRAENSTLRTAAESQDDRLELEILRQDVRIAEDQMQELRRTLTETVLSNKEMARELALLKASTGCKAVEDTSKEALLAGAPTLLQAYCERLAMAIEQGHSVRLE
mmetsp:Transcript_33118/g.69973  ORF Transcript_33118/g.69973 Transcript_33118/m.69973 type:complete len:373 (+) Transcript_33118:89-1207(+)